MKDLLTLPERAVKPRQQGITHVLDRGLSVAEVDGLAEVAGEYIDMVKLGWGTAVATGNLDAKLARYREHGIDVMFGGTLTELAIAQDRLDRLVAWLHELGLEHIEVSDGTITLEHERKLELIRRLAGEFTVISEVGSKDNTRIMAPFRWVEQIQSELEAGAWKVIAEAREGGNVGIFRHDGEVQMGLIDEIVHAVEPGNILFEAPRMDQQVWFIRRFGVDVNLGNIIPEEVLSLETMRVGLRSDTAVVDFDG
ncbi:MAG TPA: phosphosulfolactate synthase [Solirubrobacteraceae bacterium]|nr:phosphosulfolactate synthase [Solirubrobacteraceae bacterium]